jgi:hypothetical protein
MPECTKVKLNVSGHRIHIFNAIKAANAGNKVELAVGARSPGCSYGNLFLGVCNGGSVAHHAFKPLMGILFLQSLEGCYKPIWYRWLYHRFVSLQAGTLCYEWFTKAT